MKTSFWIREKVFLEHSNNPYYAMILQWAKVRHRFEGLTI
jgi:hypothetical protein